MNAHLIARGSITLKNRKCLDGDLQSFQWCTKKFSIKEFFSQCEPIHSKLGIFHYLKKFFTENFIFCAVLMRSFTTVSRIMTNKYSLVLAEGVECMFFSAEIFLIFFLKCSWEYVFLTAINAKNIKILPTFCNRKLG